MDIFMFGHVAAIVLLLIVLLFCAEGREIVKRGLARQAEDLLLFVGLLAKQRTDLIAEISRLNKELNDFNRAASEEMDEYRLDDVDRREEYLKGKEEKEEVRIKQLPKQYRNNYEAHMIDAIDYIRKAWAIATEIDNIDEMEWENNGLLITIKEAPYECMECGSKDPKHICRARD